MDRYKRETAFLVLLLVACVADSGSVRAEDFGFLPQDDFSVRYLDAHFSPDGRQIVAMASDQVVTFDSQTLKRTHVYRLENEHSHLLSSIAKDNRFAVFGGDTITIYSLNERSPLGKIFVGYNHANRLALNRRGSLLATFDAQGPNDVHAAIYDLDRKAKASSFSLQLHAGYDIAFIDESHLIVQGSNDRLKTVLQIWNVSGELIQELPCQEGKFGMCLSGDLMRLAISQDKGHMDIYRLIHGKAKKETRIRLDDDIGSASSAMNSDGDRIIAWTYFRLAIQDLSLARRAELHVQVEPGSPNSRTSIDPQAGSQFVRLSPDGTRALLASGGSYPTRIRVIGFDSKLAFSRPLSPLLPPEERRKNDNLIAALAKDDPSASILLTYISRRLVQERRWETIVDLGRVFPEEMRNYCFDELIRGHRGVGNTPKAEMLVEQRADAQRHLRAELEEAQAKKNTVFRMGLDTRLKEVYENLQTLAEEGADTFTQRLKTAQSEFEYSLNDDPTGACRFGLAIIRAASMRDAEASETRAMLKAGAEAMRQRELSNSVTGQAELTDWGELLSNLQRGWLVDLLHEDFSRLDEHLKTIVRKTAVMHGIEYPAFSDYSLKQEPHYATAAFLAEKDLILVPNALEFVMNMRRVLSAPKPRADGSHGDRFQFAPSVLGTPNELLRISSAMSLQTVPADNCSLATIHRDYLQCIAENRATSYGSVDPYQLATRSLDDGWIRVEDLRSTLADDQAVLEIVRGQSVDFANLHKGLRFLPAQYSAWLVTKHQPPKYVNLGPAIDIDAMIADARRELECAPERFAQLGYQRAEKLAMDKLDQLSRTLLAPFQQELGRTDDLIICPDGDLWLVPWAALPISQGRLLLEQCDILYQLTGANVIPTHSTQRAEADLTQELGPPVIFAEADFDAEPDAVLAAEVASFGRVFDDVIKVPTYDGNRLLGQFQNLAGTADEAARITPHIARFAGQEPLVLRGQNATEAAARSVRRPQSLVFATHGFFLPQIRTRDAIPTDPLGGAEESPRVALTSRNADFFRHLPPGRAPLDNLDTRFRAGLVLAGSNHADEWGYARSCEGLLTAAEVEMMDLAGTKLVVLSACETGVGDVEVGEGVRGLRQAFFRAGAQSVVASLWQVADDETAKLMDTFFRKLAEDQPVRAALRAASLERLKRLREEKKSHPFYWAAFTVTSQRL